MGKEFQFRVPNMLDSVNKSRHHWYVRSYSVTHFIPIHVKYLKLYFLFNLNPLYSELGSDLIIIPRDVQLVNVRFGAEPKVVLGVLVNCVAGEEAVQRRGRFGRWGVGALGFGRSGIGPWGW